MRCPLVHSPVGALALSVFFSTLLLTSPALADVEIAWNQPTRGVSIALDAVDNVYTADYEYNPGGDITLTKRDGDGHLLWIATYDQTDNTKWEKATWVAVDGEGNALVAGTVMSGYSNPVNAASILMKYSPEGQLLWRNVYESSFDGSYTKKCLVDEDDNIYVLGMGSGEQGYVTKVKKFSPEGTALWSYFDADGIGAPVNFKFAPNGDLVIAARSIFGAVNGYARISRGGERVWSFPGVYSLTAGDAAGDGASNTYLVHGVYEMGGGTTIKKLSPSGALLWSNDYAISAFRIEVGTDQCPVICGFPSAGITGAAFLKVDGDGAQLWANLDADGPHALLAHAHLLLDASNNAYLAAGLMTSQAVCKVFADGASAWTVTIPGAGYAYGIALGSTNDVFMVGGTTARLRQDRPASSPAAGAGDFDAPALLADGPNPFRATTAVRYLLPSKARFELTLFDSMGRAVRTLSRGVEGPGWRTALVDGKDLADGVYYCWLWTDAGETVTTKLTIVR